MVYLKALFSTLRTRPHRNLSQTYPALDQIGNPDDLYIWGNTTSAAQIYVEPDFESLWNRLLAEARPRLLHNRKARLHTLLLPPSAQGNQLDAMSA